MRIYNGSKEREGLKEGQQAAAESRMLADRFKVEIERVDSFRKRKRSDVMKRAGKNQVLLLFKRESEFLADAACDVGNFLVMIDQNRAYTRSTASDRHATRSNSGICGSLIMVGKLMSCGQEWVDYLDQKKRKAAQKRRRIAQELDPDMSPAPHRLILLK